MKKIVVLSGAGISAESGIQTFRDADGLWEGHDVKKVATPEGFSSNPQLVLNFYNERRSQLKNVQPNKAHIEIAKLESRAQVVVITQNVDDLHERAGSTKVIHLHGELLKARSTRYQDLIYAWDKDIKLGDLCEKGAQIRPHIVWFGEEVPMIEPAIKEIVDADIVLVVGSSMQVYPAASLVSYAMPYTSVFYLDPKPSISYELSQRKNLKIIAEVASTGIVKFLEEIEDSL
ncbi:MAG: NAD-dependent protein deacylase [Bacteroidota bacterium]